MKRNYAPAEVEYVMFGDKSLIRASECDFDCGGNCSCHSCVGVCPWDCTSDDSTCTSGDYNS